MTPCATPLYRRDFQASTTVAKQKPKLCPARLPDLDDPLSVCAVQLMSTDGGLRGGMPDGAMHTVNGVHVQGRMHRPINARHVRLQQDAGHERIAGLHPAHAEAQTNQIAERAIV